MSIIAVSQHFGDDAHVVPIYDALQDDRYFYTVIPFLGLDLQVTMQPNSGVDLNHAFLLQCLVQNLLDLQQHRIIHRLFP